MPDRPGDGQRPRFAGDGLAGDSSPRLTRIVHRPKGSGLPPSFFSLSISAEYEQDAVPLQAALLKLLVEDIAQHLKEAGFTEVQIALMPGGIS